MIGITTAGPADLRTKITSILPDAQRSAQFERIAYVTNLADEAIKPARRDKGNVHHSRKKVLNLRRMTGLSMFRGRAALRHGPIIQFELIRNPVRLIASTRRRGQSWILGLRFGCLAY